jgi:hypothetical protein
MDCGPSYVPLYGCIVMDVLVERYAGSCWYWFRYRLLCGCGYDENMLVHTIGQSIGSC